MFSLAVPNYNRCEMTLEAISLGLIHNKISEIVINDDSSDINIYEKLQDSIYKLNNNKIKLYRNEKNLKAFKNKIETIKKCSNDWIILLDSDNILTEKYIQSIPNTLEENVFYLPSHAICANDGLNYKRFVNTTIDKQIYERLRKSKDEKILSLLNTGNYLINRSIYLEAVEKHAVDEPFAVDVFYTIFLCFKNIPGFKLNIVEGMEYYHRLHNDLQTEEVKSFFVNYSEVSKNFMNELSNHII